MKRKPRSPRPRPDAWHWAAVNGCSVAKSPIALPLGGFRAHPTPQQLFGYRSQRHRDLVAEMLLTGPIPQVQAYYATDLILQIRRGDAITVTPSRPEPIELDAPTLWSSVPRSLIPPEATRQQGSRVMPIDPQALAASWIELMLAEEEQSSNPEEPKDAVERRLRDAIEHGSGDGRSAVSEALQRLGPVLIERWIARRFPTTSKEASDAQEE